MSYIKGKSVLEFASILCLNDDCLENVFTYLRLKDQVNLASSCLRFRDVFDMFSKIKYQIVDFKELLQLSIELHKFFEIAGPNIKVFKADVPHLPVNRITIICELLGTFCTNLKALQIFNVSLAPPDLQKLLHNKNLLEEINFVDVCLCDNDIDISILKNLPKLRRLALPGCFEITANSIKDLINIEELDLTGTFLNGNTFTKICTNLKELKILHISRIEHLDKICLMEAVKHLNKLETLHIHERISYLDYSLATEDFFAILVKYQKNQLQKLYIDGKTSLLTHRAAFFIGQLEKLDTLHCNSCNALQPYVYSVDGLCLYEFAKLDNLQDIDLSGCRNFGNDDLLNLIKRCRRLHKVGIQLCKQITDSFAKEVLNLLMKRNNQQTGILLISAYRSGINQDFVNASEFQSANALLKFNFAAKSEYGEEYSDSETDDNNDFWLHGNNDAYGEFSDSD